MKKCIISFILGAIIFSGITVVALSIASKDVSYDNTTSGSEKNNVQEAIDDLYEKINNSAGKIDLLWTNSSTAVAFTPQTISLDLSNYDAILLKANDIKGATFSFPNYRNNQTIIKKGTSGNVIFGGWGNSSVDVCWFAYRSVTVNDTGVTFGTGYYWYGRINSADNDYAIPVSIYGVKIDTSF